MPIIYLCFSLVLTASSQSLSSVGSDVVVAINETVDEVKVLGGDVSVLGTVLGDVDVAGGDAEINGRVGGEVAVFGGDIHLGPQANVEGNLSVFGGEIRMEDGARFGGTKRVVNSPQWDNDHYEDEESWLSQFFSAVSFGQNIASMTLAFLLGWMMLAFAPYKFELARVSLAAHSVRTYFLGYAVLLAAGISIVLLILSLIGIVLVPVLGICMAVAYFIGHAIVAFWFGHKIWLFNVPKNDLAVLALGTGILAILSMVPWIGWIVRSTVFTLSLGAIVALRPSRA